MRHRRIGNEPVALDLRDEAANPRTELDAFGVELNLGAELPPPPLGLSNCRVARSAAGSRSASPSDPPGASDRPPAPFCGSCGRGICSADCDSGSSFWACSASGSAGASPAAGRCSPVRAADPSPRAACCAQLSTALGRVAARERQRVLRFGRALSARAPCDPDVRQLGRDPAACGAVRSTRGCTKTNRAFLGCCSGSLTLGRAASGSTGNNRGTAGAR